MKGGRKPAPTLGTVLSKLFFTLSPPPSARPYSVVQVEQDGSEASIQSQNKSNLPTRRRPVAFRRVNHTFLYLYPRDT